MSWHYSQGPAGASSEDCCTGGEPLPPLKSKTTHAEFYSNGKLTESYLDSLSGTMCGRSTENRGEEKSMSSAGGSRARMSVASGKVKALLANEADSGKKWLGSFARYDQDTSLWKTHQCSLFGGLETYSETWPRWGMMHDGECSLLPMLEHDTSESGVGYLPTPCKYGNGGTGATAKWALIGVKRNKMNPNHQEWLMWWPQGWTELTALATDKFQRWLRSHGKCLEGQ